MVKLNHEQLSNVRRDPNVLRVEEDAVNHHCMSRGGITVTTPQQTPWGVSRVTAPEGWLSSGLVPSLLPNCYRINIRIRFSQLSPKNSALSYRKYPYF